VTGFFVKISPQLRVSEGVPLRFLSIIAGKNEGQKRDTKKQREKQPGEKNI